MCIRDRYKAYQNVLNFANSLFIIVFLVIIFANLIRDFTFLDNYNVKSTLPRFIAAVILAQFGYFIVAIAIDFGNILGVYAPKMNTDGVLGPNVAVPTLTDGVTGLLAFGGSNPLFSPVSYTHLPPGKLSSTPHSAAANIGFIKDIYIATVYHFRFLFHI